MPLIVTAVLPAVGPEDGSMEVTVGGGGLTVSVATLLLVEPAALVSTARYSFFDSEVLVGSIDSVVEVAPEMLPPDTLLHVVPLVETCHWIAAAEQCAGTGPSPTVNVAAPDFRPR